MRKVKYAIIGAGTSGLTAMSTIRKQTEDFVLINGGHYGTTCARVGCMPSKAMIQSANLFHKRYQFAEFGVQGGEALQVDQQAVLKRVRRLRDRFTGGVKAGTTDALPESQLISGYARFTGENRLEVNGQQIEAECIIIATGSEPVVPAAWQNLGDRLLTSDTIFEQDVLPKRMAVIGLGVIGLELGQAMSRLGVDVSGFELSDFIGGLSVPEVNQKAIELFSQEFPLYLGEASSLEGGANGVKVVTSKTEVEVDAVLASLGRRPNLDSLNLEAAGIELDGRGMPSFNRHTMQVEDKPIFIAGDVNGYRPILHEAGYEGKIAALNALAFPEVEAYERKTPLGIAFTDPEMASFGVSFKSLNPDRIEMATFDLERNNGRAIVMHEDHGLICLYADKINKCLLGGELIMPHAEHFAHLLSWAVEQRMTVLELMRMPFYHPVLEEAIQSAVQKLYYAVYDEDERPMAPELTLMQ
ncbi:dihydrolipoyl dehydrogenase [Thiomicrorhabdus sp. zzn3]|uniref:dihydrolipoyl dehydrogenase n=1 Tax=Thiomicrorhabdus sp. zzn3 TaxID=3039775 RepID=UPI002436778E|nr:dihydrolipoyl dehydrogenase [Thiomicrorhabdus sp. zzn3]MDG6777576.1 dihydrolipoyl dehydrogenase [Thiomicrorhabdus sp. zzn3]